MTVQGVRVLYRDRWLLAVEKPSGLLSQPGLGPDQADSLISRVQPHDEGPDWRLVHRLDRDTSGVLLLAAGLEALRRTSALFSNRSVNKLYLAHVRGVLAGRGCIHNRLARLQRQPPRYGPHPDGREACTLWRARSSAAGITQLWLRPITGRSHQLRSHLAGIAHPIIGDPIYGDAIDGDQSADLPSSQRLRLHAIALSFCHPFTGQRLRLLSADPWPQR
ncbi:MAG: RluA family pseudouridine synthase [Parasynechococcus sp.]|uniref:RluA family pseudouridine synthase n=1 Tax=Parasynechococcus sp. TaxID=3101203 RepID=UPI000E11D36E|nr:RluA family pseudouridine synthase [bacterium]MDC0165565.1 RluA family pseudouridine synthase [Synechococcus sp. AH-558-M21]RCL56011.1 MAG: RluA family pseudouridine synthase [Synechococcus sp. MED-G69]